MSTIPDVNTWSRKALLALPTRPWGVVDNVYHSLLIFSTGRKHESGWARMAIVGIGADGPCEVLTTCSDDVEWETAGLPLRMDCAIKSGAMHAWSPRGRFRVGHALSSLTITLVGQ